MHQQTERDKITYNNKMLRRIAHNVHAVRENIKQRKEHFSGLISSLCVP